jgi:hypothetical protein
MPPLPESFASNNLGISTTGSVSIVLSTRSGVLTIRTEPSCDVDVSERVVLLDCGLDSQEGSVRIVKTPDLVDNTSHSTPRPGPDSPEVSTLPTSISVFLQIGRQVKKTRLDLPVTLSALRLLFMENTAPSRSSSISSSSNCTPVAWSRMYTCSAGSGQTTCGSEIRVDHGRNEAGAQGDEDGFGSSSATVSIAHAAVHT